jgi:hypothetical protein
MKLLLFLTVCASALVITTGALAAAPQPAPDPFGNRTAEPLVVQPLTGPQARKLGVPAALLPGARSDHGGTSPNASGPCGACINTCWTATFRQGGNSSTGSYYENDNPVWCGNGSWITYADISRHWQSVSMWYSADGEAGPWFDGGCVGCTSIHFSLYGNFSWHPPILPVSHSTVYLGVWLQAYGSAAYA